MPWKEQNVMDARRAFIDEYLVNHCHFNDLCETHQISTKTGYKWLNRFKAEGYSGLADMSKRPHHHSQQLTEEQICGVIKLKQEFKNFGPPKICNLYNRSHHKDISLSSVKRIMLRAGFTKQRKKRVIKSLDHKRIMLEAKVPNDIWSIDFKGYWKGFDGSKCEPFTVVDQYSRYILHCQPLEKSDTDHVIDVFISLFKRYGLPKIIKSDNGAPFAHSLSPRGITRLSNWLMSLGVDVHRIEPAKPYQNGKHERMHRDLKALVQVGPRLSLREYSESLKMFQKQYNEQRPHEGIKMKFPSEVYHKSDKKYVEPSKDIDYPKDMFTKRANKNGEIYYEGNNYLISTTLKGYLIGMKIEDDLVNVYFCNIMLGYLDEDLKLFRSLKAALQLQVNE